MKESKILVLILCVIGAAACMWSYKHGPINLSIQNKAFEAPPGWTPPQATPSPKTETPKLPTPPRQPGKS